VCADKTPRPGGADWTRGDDKAEGAAVFHWNSAHSYTPTDRREGMAVTERFCGGRLTGAYTLQGRQGWGV